MYFSIVFIFFPFIETHEKDIVASSCTLHCSIILMIFIIGVEIMFSLQEKNVYFCIIYLCFYQLSSKAPGYLWWIPGPFHGSSQDERKEGRIPSVTVGTSGLPSITLTHKTNGNSAPFPGSPV